MLKDLNKERGTNYFQIVFGKTKFNEDKVEPKVELMLHMNRVKPRAYVIEHFQKDLETGKIVRHTKSKPLTVNKVSKFISKLLKDRFDFCSILFEEEVNEDCRENERDEGIDCNKSIDKK
jgi:hypothetical protein